MEKAAGIFLIACGILFLLAGLNETYMVIFEAVPGQVEPMITCYLIGIFTLRFGLRYYKRTKR